VYQNERAELGIWPYSRALAGAPRNETRIQPERGEPRTGLNFASQDYLSLSTHPVVVDAATRAIHDHGLHSAGSPMLSGNTRPSLGLEDALAEHLATPHVALFPTGWGAGFGAITSLVRPNDHVVLDMLSHACLRQGAAAATRDVQFFRHLDNDQVRSQLKQIRENDAENGIMVVTEGLFSMDSDVPALRELQELCHEFGATLLVDVAHDLGQLGPRGTGSIGVQQLLGEIDLIVGAFSKTLCTNGGFVAAKSPAVRQHVKVYGGPHIFSNALSPMQAAVATTALGIARSLEGDTLRNRLRENVALLRDTLTESGIPCLGEPSAVVPVSVGGNIVALLASRLLSDRRVYANLVEYPAVARDDTRFRMQVMADHEPGQIREAALAVTESIEKARALVGE
jgi:glycine C-acetyltransferase